MHGDESNSAEVADESDAASDKQLIWCKKVPRFGDKLLQRLNEFRRTKVFYDVTLKASDGELAAHKVVLVACGGIFRQQCVESATKRICNDVREVHVNCSVVGLLPILTFAYTGSLEITEDNLIPTFVAAQAAHLTEVEDICSELIVTRLGWVASFGGSPEHELERLRHVLESNWVSGAARDDAMTQADDARYPSLDVVRERFPALEAPYRALADWLTANFQLSIRDEPATAKSDEPATAKSDEPATAKSDEPATAKSDESATAKSDESATVKSDEPATVKSDEPATAKSDEPATAKSDEPATAKGDEPATAKSDEPATAKSDESATAKSDESATANTTGDDEATREQRETPNDDERNDEAGSDAGNNPTKSPELPTIRVEDTAQPDAATSPAAQPSPVRAPARRKAAAPKPPGPPPPALSPVSKSNEHEGRRSRESTPKPPPRAARANKVPPPRPKPPSIKRSPAKPAAKLVDYDDTLNPFADDISDGGERKVKSNKPVHTKEAAKEAAKESYNPFE